MKKEQFLPIPHCPSEKVCRCAVGASYPELCEALLKLNIDVFPVPANTKLSRSVSCHADLQLGMLKGDTAAVGKGEDSLRKRLEQLGFYVLEGTLPLADHYPEEAALDFLSFGDLLIGNKKIIEQQYLLNFSQILHIKQGYAKCNIIPVNKHALITSDVSAAATCRAAGFQVLQIRPGHIELPGYDTGFLGGCCGLIAPDCLAVAGDLSRHPDYSEILDFLHQHHVSIRTLSKGKLKDVGGIIPLKQR